MALYIAQTAAPARPGGGRDDPILHWLLQEARDLPDIGTVVGEFGRRLVARGFGLLRLAMNTRTLHPQVAAIGYVWKRGDAVAQENPREHGILESPLYLASPVRRIMEGAAEIRRRIEEPGAPLDFPILADMKAIGATDYLALPLRLSRGRTYAITLATDRPGGFLEEEIGDFRRLLVPFALVLEIKETQRVAATLLDTYLGRDAGRRVLGGLVRRGDGITIAAALWYCDLRDFTGLSERLPRDEVIALLNAFFGCMAPPVQAAGGEILKFIGDAMLAIFPIADDLDRDRACIQALGAARQALGDLDRLNEARRAAGAPPLEAGLTLHTGALMYGNIGGPDRLDFTVIGPAVNLVTRMQGLCATLGQRLLASAPFASACGLRMRSLGFHRLKGIEEPQEVLTLPTDEAGAAAA